MHHTLTDFFAALDTLYTDGKTKEIEAFLRRTMEEHRICCGGHDQIFTAALNELGTYYRGVSRYEESARAFEEAGRDILSYGTKDTVDYATNRINLAGTLRLMKQYSQALTLYEEAGNIYTRLNGKRTYYYAALLNNISLVYLDQKNYQKALDYTEQALQIIRILPGHMEEHAVSLINRGTAYWHLGQEEAAATDAKKALSIYDALSEKGVHYAAALNLCGTIDMKRGHYDQAYQRFCASRDHTYHLFGENEEYKQAGENAAAAEKKMRQNAGQPAVPADAAPTLPAPAGAGLELCRAYYEEIGRPMIDSQFAAVKGRIAVGLAGDGSECLGFDDEISRDHDWGPSFCLWLTNDDYAAFGQDLQKAYDTLPKTFRGCTRTLVPGGEGRVGVLRISDFYRQFIGLSRAPQTIAEWNSIPEYYLAKAVNGSVFTDPLGQFTAIRNVLQQYYPEDVRLKKIAVRGASMAQSGQYNYARCLKRNEVVAAGCALYEFVNSAVSMAYILNKKYTPFYKWAHHGLQFLPVLSALHDKITRLCTTPDTAEKTALIEDICTDIRNEWRLQGIADGPDDFLITYCNGIVAKIKDDRLRSLHIMQEF